METHTAATEPMTQETALATWAAEAAVADTAGR